MPGFSSLEGTAGLPVELFDDTEAATDDFSRIDSELRKPAERDEISETMDERARRTVEVRLLMPGGGHNTMFATRRFIARWYDVSTHGFPLEIFGGFWMLRGYPGDPIAEGDRWATQYSEN